MNKYAKQQYYKLLNFICFNDIDAVNEFLSDVDLKTQRAHLMRQTKRSGYTPLMLAAKEGHVEIINALLAGLSQKERSACLQLQDKQGNTAIMLATRRGYSRSVSAMLSGLNQHHRYKILKLKANKDFTALMLAVKQGTLGTIRRLLHDFNAKLRFKLLTQSHPIWGAVLNVAVQVKRPGAINTLLTPLSIKDKYKLITYQPRGYISPLFNAIFINNYRIIDVLLSKFNAVGRLALLSETDNKGNNVLGFLAEYVYDDISDTANTLLAGLSNQDRLALCEHQNKLNYAVIELTDHHDNEAFMFYLLEQGVRMPDYMLKERVELNHSQSTHTPAVHDSLARSAVRLMARYVPGLTNQQQATALAWANSKPMADNDEELRDKLWDLMRSQAMANHLKDFVDNHQPAIEAWAESLDTTNFEQAAARRCVLDLFGLRQLNFDQQFFEGNTKLREFEVLALVWCGALYEDSRATYAYNSQERDERLQTLADHLYQIQRENHLDKAGNESVANQQQEDDDSACPGGSFNQLVHTLVAIHEDVELLMVNKQSVTTYAMEQVGDLFTASDHSPDSLKLLDKAFNEDYTYQLPKGIRDKLKPLLQQHLEQAFGDFVKGNLLDQSSLDCACTIALSKPSSSSTQQIADKLAAFQAEQLLEDNQPQESAASASTAVVFNFNRLKNQTRNQASAADQPASKTRCDL